MARSAQIPKNIGEGLARIASEGRVGLKEILLSVLDDLSAMATAFNAHTHIDDNALPPGPHATSTPDLAPGALPPIAPRVVSLGTSEEL